MSNEDFQGLRHLWDTIRKFPEHGCVGEDHFGDEEIFVSIRFMNEWRLIVAPARAVSPIMHLPITHCPYCGEELLPYEYSVKEIKELHDHFNELT